jgi:ABC-type polysaccharide transport system permease subunit
MIQCSPEKGGFTSQSPQKRRCPERMRILDSAGTGAYTYNMRKKPWTKDDTQFSLLALPTALWYLLFCYFPMFGVIIAFKQYRIQGGFLQSVFQSEWVGFKNFQFLFGNKDLWMIIRNTLGV